MIQRSIKVENPKRSTAAKNGHILLVDDSRFNQVLTGNFLQQLNYSVDIADNGAEALKKCQETVYDVILMDIVMPIMDGVTATKELRKRGDRTPIIALTANDFDKKKLLCTGMDGFIAKPYHKDDLLGELGYWCLKSNKIAVSA